MANKNIIFISVVRDFAMYDRFVRENPNNAGAEFVAFDNNAENKTISVRYNSFLDSYDYSKEAWFVFCHEDFRFLEPLSSKLKLMDAAALYGPIGKDLDLKLLGSQINSNRDGSGKAWIGVPFRKPREVQTLDCQCLIVHSSLVAKYKLRFDENLTFDLYVEDFCVNAKVNHGITTNILPILSWHHSFGNVQPRFFKQLAYLNTKYSNVEPAANTTVGVLIGGHQARLRARMALFKAFKSGKFFHIKYTRSGRMVVKLFGLKIWQGFKRKFKGAE